MTRPLDATINVVYALEDSAVTIDARATRLRADEALRIDGGRAHAGAAVRPRRAGEDQFA